MKRYPLEEIPTWCQLPTSDHQDNLGGCWGISCGEVKEKGEDYCKVCEFYKKPM